MEFQLPELNQRSLSIGVRGFELYSLDNCEKEQVGYSVSTDGRPLFGFDEGDWQEGWYVIGHETLCGDPVFIDLNDPNIAVYIASHGMGHWKEVCIADSYVNFLSVLKRLESLLENGKLPSEKIKPIINKICMDNTEASKKFWRSFTSTK